MGKRRLIMAQRPFDHKGKTVIGAWSPTKKQFYTTYSPIYAYTLAMIYVIIRAAICDCAYLYVHEAVAVGAVTVATFGWTAMMKRKFERKNFVYEGDDTTQIPD